jgi:hypothetical protein
VENNVTIIKGGCVGCAILHEQYKKNCKNRIEGTLQRAAADGLLKHEQTITNIFSA